MVVLLMRYKLLIGFRLFGTTLEFSLTSDNSIFTEDLSPLILTESAVDNMVSDNGYLTAEVDGDATNELQDLIKVGQTISLTGGGGSVTDSYNSAFDTEAEIDAAVSDNGYLTSEVDGSTSNELQTISKSGSTVTLSDGGGSFTDSDTQLSESQVDAFVSDNGYLTSEVDGSTSNELQTISKSGSTVTLSDGGGSFTDSDTQLSESQVDAFVADNGYLTSEVDGSITNEIQGLQSVLNESNDANGTSITDLFDLSFRSSGTGGYGRVKLGTTTYIDLRFRSFPGSAQWTFDDDLEVQGDLDVLGNLTKSSGSFRIDHPLDPKNKWLYHSFVESPDMMNIYNGNVTTDSSGYATVTLPHYFNALNIDYRYQLTVIGSFAQAIISKEVEDNLFVIQTNRPNTKVSWQVTGIRNDKHARNNRIVPEVDKTTYEKLGLRETKPFKIH